jgi:hypothetical protein
VFVSLGGDDDLDLIRKVIARCPDLQFSVPSVAWDKAESKKLIFGFEIRAENVTPVDCSPTRKKGMPVASWRYGRAFDACDTVLIATRADKMFQLRGGLRLADALHARKRIVIAENPMAQLSMARHEKTCLVAQHDAEAIAACLKRTCAGSAPVDETTYEEIRKLTEDDAKLAFMMSAAVDPEAARRSPFAQGRNVLEAARRTLLDRGRALLEKEVYAFGQASRASRG